MKKTILVNYFILALSLFLVNNIYAQDTTNTTNEKVDYVDEIDRFRFGLHIGTIFANQHTANLYNGYGLDIDGNINNYENSFMYQKIMLQYGSANTGQPDQIAEALGVDPYTWTFDESDMPTNMRYVPAFTVGLSTKYSVDRTNAILLNVNASKLVLTGNFTIITPQSNSASATQINNRVKTFPIVGGEQRLDFQVGLQHIFGNDSKFGALIEGGLHATLAKFDRNIININNLTIDLTEYNNSFLFPEALPFRRPIGIGFGAFGSLGVNANMTPKITIQLVYSPVFVKINIGENRQFKLQQYLGIRLYYDMFGGNEDKTTSEEIQPEDL